VSDETKLGFVAFLLERVESTAKMIYPVQPVGTSRCCCIASIFRSARENVAFFFLSSHHLVLAPSRRRRRALLQKNPCAKYRVVGIAHAHLPTYAARMECSLNVPTDRAGTGRTIAGSCFSPLAQKLWKHIAAISCGNLAFTRSEIWLRVEGNNATRAPADSGGLPIGAHALAGCGKTRLEPEIPMPGGRSAVRDLSERKD
jgi:hypothetical protein